MGTMFRRWANLACLMIRSGKPAKSGGELGRASEATVAIGKNSWSRQLGKPGENRNAAINGMRRCQVRAPRMRLKRPASPVPVNISEKVRFISRTRRLFACPVRDHLESHSSCPGPQGIPVPWRRDGNFEQVSHLAG